MDGITRRHFLKGTAGFLAAGGLGTLGQAGCGSSGRAEFSSTKEEERLAVTMWEFSWLVRRQGEENEYADWDRVLDELADRGYNCIRMDAFPHLVARGPEGDLVERFTILPQTPLFFWGNHEPVEVEPRAGLAEFISKVRDRGMKVGLSTWFNDDTLHRGEDVVTPDDYARIWLETLDFLAREGLHDTVAWVDLCNEFPLGKWARGAYPFLFGVDPSNMLPLFLPWDADTRARVQRYLDEPTQALRSAYPDLRYTFSFVDLLGSTNVRNLDTSSLDLAEPHIWISNDPAFSLCSGQLFLLLEIPGSLEQHVATAPGLYFSDRENWVRILEGFMDSWAQWAGQRGLPLVTSEAWGPINYDEVQPLDDHAEWDWVKDICAEGVRMAAEKGWAGICTSNFCQPHFPGMWKDVQWHRTLTNLIRKESA